MKLVKYKVNGVAITFKIGESEQVVVSTIRGKNAKIRSIQSVGGNVIKEESVTQVYAMGVDAFLSAARPVEEFDEDNKD